MGKDVGLKGVRRSRRHGEEIERRVEVVETVVRRPVEEVDDLPKSAQGAEAERGLDRVVVRRVIMGRHSVKDIQALVRTERIVGRVQCSAVRIDHWSTERIGEAAIQLIVAYQGRAPTARWSQEYGKTQKYHDTDHLHATPPSGGIRPARGVAGTMPDSEVPQNTILPVRAAHGHRLNDKFFDVDRNAASVPSDLATSRQGAVIVAAATVYGR